MEPLTGQAARFGPGLNCVHGPRPYAVGHPRELADATRQIGTWQGIHGLERRNNERGKRAGNAGARYCVQCMCEVARASVRREYLVVHICECTCA